MAGRWWRVAPSPSGQLVVFAGLLQQFAAQVSATATILNTLEQSLIAARRVFEVLDAPVAVATPAAPVKLAPGANAITFEAVELAHTPGAPVLRGVDLTVAGGECLALTGATGAGKTTLLNLASRFFDPTAGRVTIDGIDLRSVDVRELRRHVGVVFQETFLFRGTIAENIAFAHPDAPREAIERAAAVAGAHPFIAELPLGYDTPLEEGGVNLSGGQRQRLAIARALLLDPPILLLDDPTSAVDAQTEDEILSAIESARRGRTTLLVAHRLRALRTADRIAVVHGGANRGARPSRGAHCPGWPLRARCRSRRHRARAGGAADVTVTDSSRSTERPPRTPPLDVAIIGRLFRYTRPYARMRNILAGLVVVRAIQLPLVTWAMARVLSGPIARRDGMGTVWGVLGFLALAATTELCFVYRGRFALRLGEAVVHDLRNDIQAHLLRMPMSFFSRTPVGRLVSRLTSDVDVVRVGVQDVAFVSTVQLGQAVVSAALMIAYDWRLFLVTAVLVPGIWAAVHRLRARLSEAYREQQESFSRVTTALAEDVGGIRVIQAFAREEAAAGRFSSLITRHAGVNMAAHRRSSALQPVLELNGQLFLSIVLVVGGYQALVGGVPVAALIQFLFLSNGLFAAIPNLGNQYNQALTAMAGAERVFALLDTRPEWQDPPSAVRLEGVAGRLELVSVGFGYDRDRPVLEDVSLTIEAGTTVALVGPTGSGKSTLASLVAKLYLPTSGRILVDGRDLREIDGPSFHRHVACVTQDNVLSSGTVIENIRAGRPEATDDEVLAAVRGLDLMEVIASLPSGFQTEVGEAGGRLSLGAAAGDSASPAPCWRIRAF